jgi:penicillin-binding protein 1B
LPFDAVDLRMPDGVSWLWVDPESGWLTGQHCEGAVQIPFLNGSAPDRSTACLDQQEDNEESFWRKFFGKKKQKND